MGLVVSSSKHVRKTKPFYVILYGSLFSAISSIKRWPQIHGGATVYFTFYREITVKDKIVNETEDKMDSKNDIRRK